MEFFGAVAPTSDQRHHRGKYQAGYNQLRRLGYLLQEEGEARCTASAKLQQGGVRRHGLLPERAAPHALCSAQWAPALEWQHPILLVEPAYARWPLRRR